MLLDLEQIKEIIPHRSPILMLDHVLEIDKGHSISAVKNVAADEPCLEGHFPQHAVMPGVMIIEALAQASGLLINWAVVKGEAGASDTMLQSGLQDDEQLFLVGVDQARFRRQVSPGDQLLLHSRLVEGRRNRMWRFEAHAKVGDQDVVSARLLMAKGKYR